LHCSPITVHYRHVALRTRAVFAIGHQADELQRIKINQNVKQIISLFYDAGRIRQARET